MEVTTIQKYIHTSPRKLRLVADMVRKLSPLQAVSILQVTPKAAASDLQKAISTVLANAKQQGLDPEKISFKTIEINESMKMRRFRAGTRGRVKPYKRRMGHIKIVLSDEVGKTQLSHKYQMKSEDQTSETPKLRHSDTSSSSEVSEKKKEAK